jgi:hypothetical protein
MASSLTKSKDFLEKCIGLKRGGFTLKTAAPLLGIHSGSISRGLKEIGYRWSDLDIDKDSKVVIQKGKNASETSEDVLDDLTEIDDDEIEQLPKSLQKMIKYAKILQKGGIDTKGINIKQIFEVLQKAEPTSNTEGFINTDPRHNLLYRPCKQRDLYLASFSCSLVVNGVRGTSKSVTIEDMVCKRFIQATFAQEPFTVAITMADKDLAIMWLGAIRSELRHRGYPDALLLLDKADHIETANGTKIMVRSATEKALRGLRVNLFIIDEANKIDRKLMDVLIGTLSGVEQFQMIFIGNSTEDNGAWFNELTHGDNRSQLLEDIDAIHFQFEEEDIYWTSFESKDKLKRIMDSLGTQSAVQKEMTNDLVKSDGTYYEPEDINVAFFDREPPNITPDRIVCGIDFGEVHNCAFEVIASFILNGKPYYYELYYKAFPNGTNEQIIAECHKIRNMFAGVEFAMEKSPLGGYLRKDLIKMFPNNLIHEQVFTNQKHAFIQNLMQCLQMKVIFFISKNLVLKNELKGYTNNKKNDDSHDALLHALWRLIKKGFTTRRVKG